MISNGVVTLIVYIQSEDNTSYIYKSMYDVCLGTAPKDLGFEKENYFDVSCLSFGEFDKTESNKDSLTFSYTIPKILDTQRLEFMINYNIFNLNKMLYIDKPMLVLVNSNFNFDKIKKYIENYKEYGTKEYL